MLQQPPHLRVVVDGLLQWLQRKLGDPVVPLHQRAAQDAAEHLSEQALHARGEVYGSVLVDPERHPAIHHPPEELPHGEHQPAALRLAAAELVPGAHVVEGQGAEGRRDAVDGDGPWEHHLDGALDLVLGALGVAQAEPLRLPGHPHQRAADEGGQPRQDLRRRVAHHQLLVFPQCALHLAEAPWHVLQLGQLGALTRALQYLRVLRQDGVDGVQTVLSAVHGFGQMPAVAPMRDGLMRVGAAQRHAGRPDRVRGSTITRIKR